MVTVSAPLQPTSDKATVRRCAAIGRPACDCDDATRHATLERKALRTPALVGGAHARPSAADRPTDRAGLSSRSPAGSEAARPSATGPPAPSSVWADLVDGVVRTPGRPLAPSVRRDMESGMGHDLSPVRVHDDAVAAHSARSIGALAYALGDHVVFGEGQYSPSTSVGRRLLAHELVHTLQQVGQPAAPSARLAVSEPSDPLETEAEDIARKLERRAGASRHEVEAPLSGWKARPSIGRLTAARVMRAKGEFGAPKPGPVGPPCPGYEAGERETSFTTSGLLDDDVWSTGSGQLVIADFGVDWRHLKSNVATNLTLRKWLEKFESDDSYRLSIAGYSDCVGPEANNIDLRQGRARAVEGLLGPLARSRVGFRGMAGLQTYFADNATIEGRAKNRSVVIEFEQEFTLHEQVIEANPLECGPDVTAWLSSEMSTNANNPVIKTMREVRWPRYVPFFNIGWTSGALSDFKNLVRAGGPWDFKSHSQTLGWRAAPGHSCPTKPCDSTVTLCGMCYNYDVPGNLHYGWVGAAAGLRSWLLHFAAGLVQPGQWTDDPKDAVAVSIGIDMWDDGTDMCSALSDHHDELNLDKTAACDPCT